MFEDALLESGGRLKTHRAATTLASLLMQTALVGLLLLMPLIFVDALPPVGEKMYMPAPAGQRHERAMRIVGSSGQHRNNRVIPPHVLLQPTEVPRGMEQAPEETESSPDAVGPALPGFPTGAGLGDPNSRIHHIIRSDFSPPPTVARPPERLVVSGGVMRGFLLNKVTPEYPRLARLTRIQGEVVLHAVISQEGHIERLRVMSGPPQLRAAAEHAVRQWRYRPYRLNGKPIEVETQITVRFVLGAD